MPTLVVQGERDPFGFRRRPAADRSSTVAGTHSLRSSGTIAAAVADWLTRTCKWRSIGPWTRPQRPPRPPRSRAPAPDPADRRGRALAGRVADRVLGLAAYREKGKRIETKLWTGEVDGELREGEPGALPRFSPDGSRLAYAADRGHEGRLSLWVDGAELGEIPGSVEEICWSPDGASLLVLAADIGADRAGAQSATKIAEAGAEEQDPKVFRPAQFWRRIWLVDAASGETKDVSPEGVNVFELGWAGGKVAAVCTEEPSESAWYDAWIGLIDLDTRQVERVHTPKWQLQAPRISPGGRVAWVEGFSSDRGTLTGTVHVLGQGPVAPELHTSSIEFADEDTLWVAGWRGAGTFAGRLSLDGSYKRSPAARSRSARASSRRIAVSADGIGQPPRTRARTIRPRSSSGGTARRGR